MRVWFLRGWWGKYKQKERDEHWLSAWVISVINAWHKKHHKVLFLYHPACDDSTWLLQGLSGGVNIPLEVTNLMDFSLFSALRCWLSQQFPIRLWEMLRYFFLPCLSWLAGMGLWATPCSVSQCVFSLGSVSSVPLREPVTVFIINCDIYGWKINLWVFLCVWQAEIWEGLHIFSCLYQSWSKKLLLSSAVGFYYYFNKSYKLFSIYIYIYIFFLGLLMVVECGNAFEREYFWSQLIFTSTCLEIWVVSAAGFIAGLTVRDFCDRNSLPFANILNQMGGDLVFPTKGELRK